MAALDDHLMQVQLVEKHPHPTAIVDVTLAADRTAAAHMTKSKRTGSFMRTQGTSFPGSCAAGPPWLGDGG